jgi:hypothetical protein
MYMNIGTVQLYTKSKIKVKVSSFIAVLHFTVPVHVIHNKEGICTITQI